MTTVYGHLWRLMLSGSVAAAFRLVVKLGSLNFYLPMYPELTKRHFNTFSSDQVGGR